MLGRNAGSFSRNSVNCARAQSAMLAPCPSQVNVAERHWPVKTSNALGGGNFQGTVILVHGAFHGSWCWEKVVPLLDQAYVQSLAVDLPLSSFFDDVECVQNAIEKCPGPVVLCGHSYGGGVITEAGNAPKVAKLIYISAMAVEEGFSTSHPLDEEFPPAAALEGVRLSPDGTAVYDPSFAPEIFFGDCDPIDVAAACQRLRPMVLECLVGQITTAAWRNRPSLYIACSEDRAIHPEVQLRLATHCSELIELDSSHSPFYSQPSVLAALLARFASS
jgi:pimeloyl-ACP methyl ester carboxylesterase